MRRLIALPLVALAAACGDDTTPFVQPCPGDLVRNINGACVEPTPDVCDADGIVIAELLVQPVGGDTAYQFVELNGRPDQPFDALTLTVFDGTGEIVTSLELLGDADGDGVFVVGGAEVAGEMTFDDALPINAGTIRLADCDGAVVDAVSWGALDDSGFLGEGDPSGTPPEGSSLARCDGGEDTGDNSADFGFATPSAGARNADDDFADPRFCGGGTGGECVPGQLSNKVRIEELLYNPVGPDAGSEFVELRGAPGALLDGVTLEGVNGSNGDALFAPIVLAGTIGDDGLFVIGGSAVDGADFPMGEVTFQNGPDSLKIIDCAGEVLDAIGFGNFDGDVFEGEGTATGSVSEGLSLSRCPGAADSGDNGADFGASTPSPGAMADESDFEDPTFCGGEGSGDCTLGALDIEINEVLYDPDGPDAGLEFIELRGAAGAPVTGASVVAINGGNGERYGSAIPLAGAFDDAGLFLIGGEMVADVDALLPFSLQNGPDSVVVLDCDGLSPLDAVGYGEAGDDEVFAGEGDAAPLSGSGMSLVRCPGNDDSDDNARDFTSAAPSPGAVNDGFVDPLFCDFDPGECTVGALDIEISEVLYDPAGADDGLEFVELRGTAGAPVTGATLVALNGASGEPYGSEVRLAGVFDENGIFVVGGALVDGADTLLPFSLQQGPDSVVILDCDGTTPLDAVGYGAVGDDEFFSGEGNPAPPSGQGLSIVRCPARSDTDDNSADFTLATPSPDAVNDGFVDTLFCDFDPSECVIGAASGVVINEVVANPVGSDGDAMAEFIELRAAPGQALGGLWLAGVNGGDGTPFYGPARLAGDANENGYYVVGQANVAEADQALVGALQNGPDSIVLYDCDGESVLDALGYGSFDEEDVFAGEGSGATVTDRGSTARCEDDADSDDNAADFGVATPTPGAENDGFEDPLFCSDLVCLPVSAGAILINEVLYDAEGADAGFEFVELRAPVDTDLIGLTLVGINGTGGTEYARIPLDGVVDSSGLFVVGEASVAEADQLATLGLQNGPDSIQLLDCTGAVVDAVAYGDFGDGAVAAGEGTPAAGVDDTETLGRVAGGDTDDNATDFTAMSPTPGAPNPLPVSTF